MNKDYSSRFTLTAFFISLLFFSLVVSCEDPVPVPKNYTVTFDSRGGSSVASIVAKEKTSINSPTAPTKAGHTFKGWFKDAKYTTKFDFTDIITSNITLYAKWETNSFTIVYDSQGGSKINSIKVDYGTTITKPTPPPTRLGHVFAGWFKEAAGTTAFNFATEKITVAITLYAKWVKNADALKITFDSQGGSSVEIKYTIKDGIITVPTPPTKTGYTFEGWFRDVQFTTRFDFETDKITADITLYAKWKANSYTVTFDSQGGSAVNSQTIDYNKKALAPTPPPTRAGHLFAGWFKEAAATTPFNFETDKITVAITLYVKWIKNADALTVTFDSQGGSSVEIKYTIKDGTITAPTAPTRTGYTFERWFREATFTTVFNFGTDKITANIRLYAKWTANSYTVAFDSQDGSAVSSIQGNYDETILAPTTPTRTGYVFVGWFKEAAATTAFNFGTDKITGDITLYAKWIKESDAVTVTFDSQGGSAVTKKNTTKGGTITAPTAPTKADSVFGGWFKDVATTTAFVFGTDKITANITLYAKWIKSYTVSFNSNDGTLVSPQTVETGKTITKPTPSPTKTGGYVFDGWFKDAATTTAFVFGTDKITADITLYAKWIKTYTVGFNSQGGLEIADLTVKHDETITEPTKPTRTGYTFEGWFREAAGTTAFNFGTDKITANITLYAKWKAKTYTVTFDSQEGTAVNSQTIDYNKKALEPTPPPTKTGYLFAGWFREAAATTAFVFATDKITGDITLYAKWVKNADALTVTFDSQGGSDVKTINTVKDAIITAPTAPTRTGYLFEGWFREAAATTAFNFATDKITANITLYAKWIRVYKVTFNSQGGSKVDSLIVKKGEKVTVPTPPTDTKTDSVFAGWYTDAACSKGKNFDFAKAITTDTTLYAFWKIQPTTRAALVAIINGKTSLRRIDVSKIDSMNNLFNEKNFSLYKDNDMTEWDVSKVTDMQDMFHSVKNFNQEIGGWDVSNVTDMAGMFNEATSFNQLLNGWNVSNVKEMHWMFNGATAFNQVLGSWKVSNVTNMENMFRGATSFNQNIAGWDVSKVTNWLNIFANGCPIDDSNKPKFNKKVTFDSQGGSDIAVVFVKEGEKMTEPTPPTKTGDVFGGWFKDAATTTVFNFETETIKADITLYAKWIKTANAVTVTFDSKGGSVVQTKNTTKGEKIIAPVAPTKADSVFAGWYKDAARTKGQKFDFTKETITADTTLYAFWKIQPKNREALNNIIGQNKSLRRIDVSLIGDMGELFRNKTDFNILNDNDISEWDVSNVWNMRNMFLNSTSFNQDIGKWDVSNVTNMEGMFQNVRDFNQDISSWNVSKVANMNSMFFNAPSFNQDISSWKVDNVTNMNAMFQGVSKFNYDISGWNVSKVTDMGYMFRGAAAFNQDISGWNVSNVTNMESIFRGAAAFNQDIGKWENNVSGSSVSKVTNMEYMFKNAKAFNQDISGWNVSNVTNMEYMFEEAEVFNQDIGGWDVSKVTNMEKMFNYATSFNQNISGWNVDKVTNRRDIFNNCPIDDSNKPKFNKKVTFDTQGGSSISSKTVKHGDKITAPTPPPTKTGYTLDGWYKDDKFTTVFDFGTETITADITLYVKWKAKTYTVTFNSQGGSVVNPQTIEYNKKAIAPTPEPTKTDYVFGGWFKDNTFTTAFNFETETIKAAITLYAKWVKNADALKVTFDSQGGSDFVKYVIKDAIITAPTKPTKTGYVFVGWFRDAAATTAFDFATEKITAAITLYAKWVKEGISLTVIFNSQGGSIVNNLMPKSGEKITAPAPPTKADSVFAGWYKDVACSKGKKFDFTKEIMTADTTLYAFWKIQPANRAALKTIIDGKISLRRIDVSKITDMKELFKGKNDFSIYKDNDITEWNVSNVTTMQDMFSGATNFNQEIGDWDVSNVVYMAGMFNSATSFNQPLNKWNVSNVKEMHWMFHKATSFDQPLNDWTVSSVTNMSYMFFGATAFNQNIGSWTVSSVTNMENMFNGATSFNQNISGWNVALVTTYNNIFANGCPIDDSNKPATFR